MVAVLIAAQIATGTYGLAALLGVAAVSMCAVTLLRLPLDSLVLAAVVAGYILGNRGFAQLSLLPMFPLLPAEAALAVGGTWLLIRSALQRRLPWRADLLNAAVIAWIAIGAARIFPDLRLHGAVALRDFAMVYYALFFFLAQAQAEEPRRRTLLDRTVLVAVITLIPLFELFRRFPDFFLERLTVSGTPLIFFKGDLAATLLAVAALAAFQRHETTRRSAWLLVSAVAIVLVLSSESRAALVALVAATIWLAAAGRWRWFKVQAMGLVLAAIVLLGALAIGELRPGKNPLTPVLDRVASIVDPTGRSLTRTTEAANKLDNNQFRLVWWRTVLEETVAGGPWLGLGFGYDLSAGFVRVYYPDTDEEFTTRSPHNILLTVFGRMGAAGLLAFVVVLLAAAGQTFRALRSTAPHEPDGYRWLAAWVLFVSACFGVVLEGPMGAVVFWTLLGAANAASAGRRETALPAGAEPLPDNPPDTCAAAPSAARFVPPR